MAIAASSADPFTGIRRSLRCAAVSGLSRALAIAIAIATLGAGCQAQVFRHGGASTRASSGEAGGARIDARALPPPRVALIDGGPIAGQLAPVTVVSHGRHPDDSGFLLQLVTGRDEPVTVAYDIGGARRIPVSAGQKILLRYFGAADEALPGALVVATPRGEALAYIVRRDGLPSGVLPAGLHVAAANTPDHLAYTEVLRLPSLCVAQIEHYDLGFIADERVSWLAPGASEQLIIAGTPFEAIAFDASTIAETTCPGAALSHMSYALIALRSAPEASNP